MLGPSPKSWKKIFQELGDLPKSQKKIFQELGSGLWYPKSAEKTIPSGLTALE